METGLGIEPSGGRRQTAPDGFAARGERQLPKPVSQKLYRFCSARLTSMSEVKRTADGFVVAFPPLESDSPFERDPVVEAYKKDVDRTLIIENLKLTVEERLRQLVSMQRFAAEVRRAGRAGFGY